MTNARELLEALVRRETESPEPPPQTADEVWRAIEGRLAAGQPVPELDTGALIGGTSKHALMLKIIGGGVLATLIALGLGVVGRQPPPDAPPTKARVEAVPAEALTAPQRVEVPRTEPVVTTPVDPVPPSPTSQHAGDGSTIGSPPSGEPRKPARARRSEPEPRPPKTLADEVALARRISSELKKAAWKRALLLVAEHERDFPDGELVEERQAAKARALCHVGNGDAGRKEALAFERRWPTSIHLAVVRRDCEEI